MGRKRDIPAYRSWQGMKTRCYNQNRPKDINYKERGTIVCKRWINSFENFLEDMGPRPDGTSIDRKDNNGNYEPSNCRWATNKEQQRNRYNNRMLSYNGRRQCLAEWAEELNVPYLALRKRLRNHKFEYIVEHKAGLFAIIPTGL